MKTSIKNLLDFLEQSRQFHLVSRAAALPDIVFDHSQIHYLNPIRPQAVHLIGHHEQQYLQSLDLTQQRQLAQSLSDNQAKLIVFEKDQTIPESFTSQKKLTVVSLANNDQLTPERFSSYINHFYQKEIGLPGSLVVVFNQGLFITGESGIGKSELLLSLIERGHLWVADDLTMFRLTRDNTVVASACEKLFNYIHVKTIGLLNMDHEFGRARQLKNHKLAACIHLSNNIAFEDAQANILDQQKTIDILGQGFPSWQFSSGSKYLALYVESCARQLNLENWKLSATTDIKTISIS